MKAHKEAHVRACLECTEGKVIISYPVAANAEEPDEREVDCEECGGEGTVPCDEDGSECEVCAKEEV